jgi:hypothetical protein
MNVVRCAATVRVSMLITRLIQRGVPGCIAVTSCIPDEPFPITATLFPVRSTFLFQAAECSNGP